MQHVGSLTTYHGLNQIAQAIFRRNKGETLTNLDEQPKVQCFPNKKLYYVDHAGVRYVEQNPNTRSEYAARAKKGAKIIWVIRLRDNQYLGRIEDGEVFARSLY